MKRRHQNEPKMGMEEGMPSSNLSQNYQLRTRPIIIMPSHFNNDPRTAPLTPRNSNNNNMAQNLFVSKTVDYSAAIVQSLQNRIWQRDHRDRRALEPDRAYASYTVTPSMLLDNTANALTTRFVKSVSNIIRTPISCLAWTPQGRRLITASTAGEFTVWDGLTLKSEYVLQAHCCPVNAMVWTHNDIWMLTVDSNGYVKYWQSNLNNVNVFKAHDEATRGISFSPSDQKFVTGSDDGKVKVWDFTSGYQEQVLRGHGDSVTSVDWHPCKGLIISGSKDSQQPVRIWDPRSGVSVSTLHVHKMAVTDARWNRNGNFIITASRDSLVKLFDLRKLPQVLGVFRGHKKGVTCVSWHPIHESLFASGDYGGSIFFWNIGCMTASASIPTAHSKGIWNLAWHPVGHILCSVSADQNSKFWARQKPGDVIARGNEHQSFRDYRGMKVNEMEEAQDTVGTQNQVDNRNSMNEIIPCLDLHDSTVESVDLDTSENIIECQGDVHPAIKTTKEPSEKILGQHSIPLRFETLWYNVDVIDEEEGRNPYHLSVIPR